MPDVRLNDALARERGCTARNPRVRCAAGPVQPDIAVASSRASNDDVRPDSRGGRATRGFRASGLAPAAPLVQPDIGAYSATSVQEFRTGCTTCTAPEGHRTVSDAFAPVPGLKTHSGTRVDPGCPPEVAH